MRVTASPQSLCGLRAVDQSVLLQKPEAELSPSLVSHLKPLFNRVGSGPEVALVLMKLLVRPRELLNTKILHFMLTVSVRELFIVKSQRTD